MLAVLSDDADEGPPARLSFADHDVDDFTNHEAIKPNDDHFANGPASDAFGARYKITSATPRRAVEH
jgi:hypothetical protein